MEEQKLRQLFKNRSNCYVDTDDVVQGMDEDCFIETMNEALSLHDVSGRSEQLVNFLLHLNDKELINNHDFDYEKEAKKYLKKLTNCHRV